MATTTNFGWETPDDTDLVKDGAAAMRTLGNAIDTSFVDLKGGTTNQVLAKNSNTDLDFKWVADATGIPATIIDAKGDLIAGTAADTADRLAVGTNGHVLTADSTTATGLKWAAASSSPTFAGCALYRTSGVTITNTVISQISFTAEVYDTDSYHSTSTNTSRITIPTGKGGKYLLTGWALGSAGPTSGSVYVYKNGTATTELPIQRAASVTGYGVPCEYSNVINLVAGDYIEFYFLTAGGASNPTFWGNNADATDGVFTVTWLGA